MSLKIKLEELKSHTNLDSTVYTPLFFNIRDKEGKEALEQLLSKKSPVVNDCIQSQLQDLIKLKHPQNIFSNEALNEKIAQHLGGLSILEYGVWVYYPWSNRLNHILEKEEFIAVRTSRNIYKITPYERTLLSTKKIGIIGLSVGQSVSVTLAMERIAGELRLADFDVLELTNLNRIRTGIHNLGVPKVHSVAREISEIDPYIKVHCYPEGINEKNIHQFFTEGGNLDLLVEESDGFDIKILSRIKARELRIPVIMEASDRCMVDVERFDLEPERDILHGLVNHLDLATLKKLKTNEEKIPYMLDILGIETASKRLKASMLEIEQSICTWPQLASAVTMGGGITADVSRRILLNQFTDSGRYYVDIEQLITNQSVQKEEVIQIEKKENHPVFDFETLLKHCVYQPQTNQVHISQLTLESIIKAANLAPSGGNSQPWRWVYKNKLLYLFNAIDVNDKFLGYGNFSTYVALGAAIENLILKSNELKLKVVTKTFPKTDFLPLVCLFEFSDLTEPIDIPQKRIEAIQYRLTNRKIAMREELEMTVLQNLKRLCEETSNAKLKIFTTENELERIGDILGELEKIRILEKNGHSDFVEEIRWTKEENDLKKDGVDLRTLDLTNSEKIGFQLSKDADLISLLNEWDGGGAFKKLTKKSILAASGIGIITMKGNDKSTFLEGGKVLQRIWLEANANQIAFQPMSSSVFLYARLLQGKGEYLTEKACNKLLALREAFENAFRIDEGYSEIFIFRLFKGTEPQIKSLRIPLEETFLYKG